MERIWVIRGLLPSEPLRREHLADRSPAVKLTRNASDWKEIRKLERQAEIDPSKSNIADDLKLTRGS